MLTAALILFFAAFLASVLCTWVAKRSALRLGLMDQPGYRKVHTKITPRNGGIGIFWGIALPMLVGLIFITIYNSTIIQNPHHFNNNSIGIYSTISIVGIPIPHFTEYIPGMLRQSPLAILLLLTTFGMHLLGLLDDRKAMAPIPKLLGQFTIAAILVIGGEMIQRGGFRLPMLFGNYMGPGFYLSTLLSILWIVTLTNAFNFLDNMDGLSAGVAFICAGLFLVAAGSGTQPQYFICGMLLLFMGSVLGFLCYNFPPASIFMGDGGSMVLGFFLSALTIRTTVYHPQQNWYVALMPLVILAVPLYDLIVVSFIRILQGKSPMVGDTNHFSHRLTRHGFSKRGAVLVIYAVTLACGISAPLLATANDVEAILIGIQCVSMLTVIGILERVGEHTAEHQNTKSEIPAGDKR